jgi:hypothetical protein
MTPTELELHDAIIETWAVDFGRRELRVVLRAYIQPETSTRESVELVFEELKSFSCIADLGRLHDNERSGNVNYWVPSQDGGTTFIYVMDGCLAIDAARVGLRFVRQPEPREGSGS